MKFKEETIRQFNLHYNTKLTKKMSFFEIVKNIEKANNSYFYISMDMDDVIEAINDEKEIANKLGLNNVYVKNVGVYIALIT